MIRRVRESDVPAVVEMVHELARYEKEPDSCHLTEEQLHRALFAPNRPCSATWPSTPGNRWGSPCGS